ncbi:hypothetical protein LshimejAT787_1204420 [Lyophyllum shimeji]|uniref:Uncharacterized protein n=1 Tax=Lyophyllum shimeji TaxID=47721 RepID=A0A9P3PWQ4_LYOSH|nr:hypothetical protein LshimejAT787_1204420 [Lyophyllum shimeji]
MSLAPMDQTDAKTYDGPYSGIPTCSVVTLRDPMQELERHLVDHVNKVRSLKERLMAMDSTQKTSAPIADAVILQSLGPHTGDDQVAGHVHDEASMQPKTSVVDADPEKPSAPHLAIDVLEPLPAAETWTTGRR